MGDVYRATHRAAPDAIGLIDGLLRERARGLAQGDSVRAVEGRACLRRGEHGSASRRRAAGSSAWSGIGAIFEDYRDNRIEDDDEVAIVHGPAELDYLPLTEAMVNIRATVEARRQGIVSSAPLPETR